MRLSKCLVNLIHSFTQIKMEGALSKDMFYVCQKKEGICFLSFEPQHFWKGQWISPVVEASCKFFVKNTAQKTSHIAVVLEWACMSRLHLRVHL